MTPAFAVRSATIQVLAVVVFAASSSLVATLACVRHPANALWMFGIPIAVALWFNHRAVLKAVMAVLLAFAGIIGTMLPELILLAHNELRPDSRIMLRCTYF